MSQREIRFINTLSGKKEVFKPRVPGKVTFYSCGPTVWNLIHIGNLRAAMVADLIFRFFKYSGYEVNYVRNYTDIEDKIIAQSAKEGISTTELTRRYIQEVEKDYAVAGLLDPTRKTLATDHIPEMIHMIQQMIENQKAYVVEGEVFFSIGSFEGYGKLSHKKLDDLISGIRVEVDTRKRNPMDFTLWKPAKPGEPSWQSPWGAGRPGWHIECSAMACKWLGNQIDVHHGGIDLIFPHHENEIAQSESATGAEPFVGTWLHNAHLTLSQEKMSKSVGNVFLARDFLTQYSGEIARFLLMSVHYRSSLDFNDASVDGAISSLNRIYLAKQKAEALVQKRSILADPRAEALWGSFASECEKQKDQIEEAFANDLNTAGAFGSFFTLIREFNRVLSEPRAEATPGASVGAQLFLDILKNQIGAVIGVGGLRPEKALADLNLLRSQRGEASPKDGKPTPEQIEALIQERKEARLAKNFARADEIRKHLDAQGVELKDSPTGSTWIYK